MSHLISEWNNDPKECLPFDEDQFLSIDSYVGLAIKTPISFV